MTHMIETHIRQDETVVCRPSGDLDWRTSVSLRHAMHDALRPGARVLIDLRHVSHIDAVGLSAIAGTLRRARAVGARLRVHNMQPPVRRRMELVGIGGRVGFPADARGDDAA
jgi:anti-sigma B factor antagonist